MRKEDWFEEGMNCLDRKDYEGAGRAFQQAIGLDPRDGAPWAMLGLARANGGNRAGAIEAYRRALTFLPRCDLARETREKLNEFTRQDLAINAPGQGTTPLAAKKIAGPNLPRGAQLKGITWRPRAKRQLAYLSFIGMILIETLAGIASVFSNIAFAEYLWAMTGRTYSPDSDYLFIWVWVVTAVIGIFYGIGRMTGSLHIDRDGITWRPWYFSHHYPWSQIEEIGAGRQPLVNVYKPESHILWVKVHGEEPLQIKIYRFRDPIDPKTGKVQKIEDVLRTYWEAFKQRVIEISLEKNKEK